MCPESHTFPGQPEAQGMPVVGVNLGKLMHSGDINSACLRFVSFGPKHDRGAVSDFFNFVIKNAFPGRIFKDNNSWTKRRGKHENYQNKQFIFWRKNKSHATSFRVF